MAKQVTATGPVEGPWALPDGWRWERIDSVAPVNPRRASDNLADDVEVAFVPMAAVTAETGGIDVSTRRLIASVRKGFTRFGSGDVIFAKITPCMENGKAAVVPALPHGVGFGSTEFHVLSPRDVSARFLYHWISQRGFRETAEFNMTGTAGQKRVPTDFMRDALIPVPPRPVQDVIVARIDELFTEIDDGEAALARARTDLATWRKALLKAAVTGELTADWRAANPPNGTDTDFVPRARSGPSRRASSRPVVDYTEVVSTRPVPSHWAPAPFEQLFDVLSDNGMKIKERDYQREGRFPVIDQGARPIAGYTDDEAMVRYPDVPWILFGDHTRRFKLVEHPFCVGADGIKIVRPVAGLDPRFAFRMLQNAHFEDRGYSRHFQFVRALQFAVPPLAEQERIASLIDNALADGKTLVGECREVLDDAATLRQSILAAAFRGELA